MPHAIGQRHTRWLVIGGLRMHTAVISQPSYYAPCAYDFIVIFERRIIATSRLVIAYYPFYGSMTSRHRTTAHAAK
jgi:hypothetical protein